MLKTVPRSHDPDTPAGLTRRQWLQGTLALAAVGLASSQVLRAAAQGPTESLDAFIALPQAPAARPVLDRGVGMRLLAAFGKSNVDFVAQLRPLAWALAVGPLSDAQQKTALQILEAQYLGVVDGNVVIYEQALMYSVILDTFVMRTYCPNQSGFWAEPPVERQAR